MLRAEFLHLKYNTPGPGIEPRSPACKAGVPTSTLPRVAGGFSVEDLRSRCLCFRGHYAGTRTTEEAKRSGKPLWSSEDYSTLNDETGAGCMARVSGRGWLGWDAMRIGKHSYHTRCIYCF